MCGSAESINQVVNIFRKQQDKIMKQLRFLIIALGLTMAQVVLAVTLPSTSYQPYSVDTNYEGLGINVGTVNNSMTFSALGDGGSWGDECARESSHDILACQNCCVDKFSSCCPGGECEEDEYNECKKLQLSCANDCGRSLPLNGGEWVLILMVVLAVALKIELATRLDK